MKRLAEFALIPLLALFWCACKASTTQTGSAPPGASPTPQETSAIGSPALPGKAPESSLTSFGATDAQWEAHHVPAPGFAAGSTYGPLVPQAAGSMPEWT